MDSTEQATNTSEQGTNASEDTTNASDGTDSVEKLFASFPDPDSGDELDDNAVIYLLTIALRRFVKAPPSQDPDYEYLLTHAKRSLAGPHCPVTYFRQQLAHLAVQKPPQRKDKSPKGRQLKWHRWMALGRKSEAYPFVRKDNHPPPSTRRLEPLTCATICEYCRKDNNVNMRCPGCSISDENFLIHKSTYCNKKCLEADAKAHKSLCDARRMIYRTTKLIHSIFVALQEVTYMYPLEKVSSENGVTYVTDGSWDRAVMTGRPVFYPFPKNVTNSPDLRRALMYWGQAEEVSLSLYGIIVTLFRPMCKVMEIANIIPRNVMLPLCQISNGRAISNCLYKHQVLRLSLKSEEVYVIDLTAVQLGWKEILAPWFPWVVFRTDRVEIGTLVPTHGLLQSVRSTLVQSDLVTFQLEVRATVVRSIINELESLIEAHPLYNTFDEIIRAPNEEYRKVEWDIADIVKRRIFIMIKSEHHKDPYRLWGDLVSAPFDIKLARKKAKVLKEVWLTPKEFDRLKKSGAAMKMIWAERIKGKLDGKKDEEEERGEDPGENSGN
ncbi:hypothetical protein GGR51DRAFT_562134 [Nemania sp. FL0031]|nr:hypothetical protein GGR51DRAFT_562134 [Nemania sp. FL0031]